VKFFGTMATCSVHVLPNTACYVVGPTFVYAFMPHIAAAMLSRQVECSQVEGREFSSIVQLRRHRLWSSKYLLEIKAGSIYFFHLPLPTLSPRPSLVALKSYSSNELLSYLPNQHATFHPYVHISSKNRTGLSLA